MYTIAKVIKSLEYCLSLMEPCEEYTIIKQQIKDLKTIQDNLKNLI